ncbi:hypothetical protein [Clostridium sp.]|uniref:hypothetical protein n=1 Tax=Clostridium sp. TaxID=1506 RepID=UPI001A3A6EBB|nr:hypothetical protein [Clostridium sp.]MBK5241300.1 hypothetical protein [Clostridium sp.]
MYKSIKYIRILVILVMLMGILSFKLLVIKNKTAQIKDQSVLYNKAKKNINEVEKFGYSDILECLSKNSYFKVESINMREKEECSVEVIYSGDIKLLYSSLHNLIQSKNFLEVETININKEAEITNISMSFIKNK